MASRDLNKRAAAFKKSEEKERKERFDVLEEAAVGLVQSILERTFPLNDDDTPNWDKFDWQRGTQLVSTLRRFQNDETPADNTPQRQRGERRPDNTPPQPAPEKAAAAPAKTTDTPDPSDEKKKWWQTRLKVR